MEKSLPWSMPEFNLNDPFTLNTEDGGAALFDEEKQGFKSDVAERQYQ